MSENRQLCGGALIAPDLVLTAAHCGDFTGDIIKIGARDLLNLDGGAELRTCDQWKRHPDFVSASDANQVDFSDFLDNDFALCKLNEPIFIDETKARLVLNDEDAVPITGDPLHIMGHGDTQFGGTGPTIVHDVTVSYIDNDTCAFGGGVSRPSVNGLKLCAGDKFVNSCQGDSGGPVVRVMDTGVHLHVGLNSFGFSCGNTNSSLFGSPGVKARTSKGMDWIKTTACDLQSPFFCASESPSESPTKKPTNEPTIKPTNEPSKSPKTKHGKKRSKKKKSKKKDKDGESTKESKKSDKEDKKRKESKDEKYRIFIRRL
jgi:secreted trypsin-like serine protease